MSQLWTARIPIIRYFCETCPVSSPAPQRQTGRTGGLETAFFANPFPLPILVSRWFLAARFFYSRTANSAKVGSIPFKRGSWTALFVHRVIKRRTAAAKRANNGINKTRPFGAPRCSTPKYSRTLHSLTLNRSIEHLTIASQQVLVT